MSRGKQLQEMESASTPGQGGGAGSGAKQSRTAVNSGASAPDPIPSLSGSTPGQTGSYEDLGGPTPENYKSDDDSAKLKTPGTTLKQVRDVVNKGAKPAEAMKEEEDLEDEDILSEEEGDEDEVDEVEDTEEGEDEEEEEVVEEEFDIEEDVNALLAGEDLSEEFQEKARTIFEAALRSKVSEIKETLEEQYSNVLAEEVEEIKTELAERVDSYLEYVADEWISENALAVEQGLKTEMTESFLQGMRGLFEEHYVTIPEEKYNVLESMVEKLDDMETKLNEQIEKNISLNKRLSESVADGIFEQVSEGLADTQKDKLASLSESVEFESEIEYREKLETLRESYFPSRGVSPSARTETLSEGVDSSYESHSGSMANYLKTLSSFSK
jgi:phage terminase Nu1 subunit (DNA packaging protein)